MWLLHEDLVRCFEAETFSGAMVEAVHGEGNVPFGDRIETRVLGEELADEVILVLVGAMLPGGVGMGKKERTSTVVETPSESRAATIAPHPCIGRSHTVAPSIDKAAGLR